jgi:NAD+ synthase
VELTLSVLNADWGEIEENIERFIRDYIEKTRAAGLVIGLSGGIDSCTAAALSARAIGGNKVLGLQLPEKETQNAKDCTHANIVAKKFGFITETVDMTPSLETLYKTIPSFNPCDNVSKGNIKARMRMTYLYYYASRLKSLVCGSSDKSETMIGYFTKWGDVAADIHPIMDLYKTQVRQLAKHLGIPEEIISKPSSPRLWTGQLAEKELGMKYEQLDLILYGLEHFMKAEELAERLRIDKDVIEKVKVRWLSAEHKRRVLLTAKLEYRTIGADFRLPRGP